jgi:hypothetical protein
MVAHIRGRISHAGIAALVRGHKSAGVQWVIVEAEQEDFTPKQCRQISLLACINGLTYAGGEHINCTHGYWDDREPVAKFSFLDNRPRIKAVSTNSWTTTKRRATAHESNIS